jgi:hypothetical protein
VSAGMTMPPCGSHGPSRVPGLHPSGLIAGESRRFGGNHGGTRGRTDRSGEDRRSARDTPDIPQCRHVHPRYHRRLARRARAGRRVHVLDRDGWCPDRRRRRSRGRRSERAEVRRSESDDLVGVRPDGRSRMGGDLTTGGTAVMGRCRAGARGGQVAGLVRSGRVITGESWSRVVVDGSSRMGGDPMGGGGRAVADAGGRWWVVRGGRGGPEGNPWSTVVADERWPGSDGSDGWSAITS